MIESKIERRFVQGVKALGCLAYKFVSPGNAGVPDRIVILPGGRVLFVELKTDDGKLSLIQARTHNAISRMGAEVYTVYGAFGVTCFLDMCKEKIEESNT